MGRQIGYARVSTHEQELDLQVDALVKEGCDPETIFTDRTSGANTFRPGLELCLKELTPGDTLIVWRMAPRSFGAFNVSFDRAN